VFRRMSVFVLSGLSARLLVPQGICRRPGLLPLFHSQRRDHGMAGPDLRRDPARGPLRILPRGRRPGIRIDGLPGRMGRASGKYDALGKVEGGGRRF